MSFKWLSFGRNGWQVSPEYAFYVEDDNFYVIYIGKRDEVYESWA